jgi:hypothetical protein
LVPPGRAASGSPLQNAQLVLHRVEKLVRLLRDRVPAETHTGKDQKREHTADHGEAPPARSRPEPSETARASVEENGEEQPGEYKEEGARSSPNEEKPRCRPKRDSGKLEAASRDPIEP